MFEKFAEDVVIRCLEKLAALKDSVELREHQQKSIDKLLANDGRALIAHATGTGKTLTGIAGFEKLKELGKGNRALVVVPNSLRSNFKENLEKFTDSSYVIYGPGNEKNTKNVTDSSSSDYNIVGYETFNRHKDELLKAVKPDTLIIDEVHRSRNNQTNTFHNLQDASREMNNVITLTGSVVNNEPADIVPLMDITFGAKPPIENKDQFNRSFVTEPDRISQGWFRKNLHGTRHIKHKNDLDYWLDNRVDYVPHTDVEEYMPSKHETIVKVPMSERQTQLYEYALDTLDPMIRSKIQQNIPMDQKEIGGLFKQLIRARQVSTDPTFMDPEHLEDMKKVDVSPKINKVIEDLKEHLDENDKNKVVIYGNLVQHQLDSMSKALDEEGIRHSDFMGIGVNGMTAADRQNSLDAFKKGKNRVLLLSAAGGEGLDLPDATMLQMLEGHYNPEKIQQAEARVRRMSNDKIKDNKSVEIKKYLSVPNSDAQGFFGKLWNTLTFNDKAETGIDEWIYDIAQNKNSLNNEFRSVIDESRKKHV